MGKPCNDCGLRPRAASKNGRMTWCQECQTRRQRAYRAGERRAHLHAVPDPVRDENGCLLWQGATTKNGYGFRTVNGRAGYAHRHAYEQAYGPIPDGLVIDHTCCVRRCIEPTHLEVVTVGENTRRGVQRRMERLARERLVSA